MRAKRPSGTVRLSREQKTKIKWQLQTHGLTDLEAEDLTWSLETWVPVATSPDLAPRRHFKKIERSAADLRKLLAISRPLWNTSKIDWLRFDREIGILVESAKAEAAPSAEPLAGRRSEKWRDDLISLARSQYPSRVLGARGGEARFVEFVELLLECLDVELADVRSAVKGVLRRGVRPPFTVKRG